MKIRSLLLTLLALTLLLAPPSPRTALARGGSDQNYSATLLSPPTGAVLRSGQVVRVSWKTSFPAVDISMCETELLVSLDGGNTYTFITSQRNPKIQYFDWTVPKVRKGAPAWAILDIRFGCLNIFPETYSPQVEHAFMITSD